MLPEEGPDSTPSTSDYEAINGRVMWKIVHSHCSFAWADAAACQISCFAHKEGKRLSNRARAGKGHCSRLAEYQPAM